MTAVPDALDATADLFYVRWKRAVDRLWREAVRLRRANLQSLDRARSARRLKNLQKIVRKALSEYHRVELERARRDEPI